MREAVYDAQFTGQIGCVHRRVKEVTVSGDLSGLIRGFGNFVGLHGVSRSVWDGRGFGKSKWLRMACGLCL